MSIERKMIRKRQLRAEGLLAFNTVVWGGTYIAIKFGLDGFSSFMLVAVRYALATLACAALALVMRPRIAPHLRQGLLLGLFLFIGISLQTRGLLYTSAAKSGFITGMFVVFTPFIDWVWSGRRPGPENYAGIALVLGGLFLLTWPAAGGLAGFNFGDFLTILSAVGFSFYIVTIDRVARPDNTLALILIQMGTTAVLGAAWAILLDETRMAPRASAVYALAYLVLPGTLLMAFIQTRYQAHSNPVRAAIIFSLEPVFAALFAWWLLGESLPARAAAGASLMFAGVILSETWKVIQRGRNAKRAPAAETARP